MAPSPDDAPGQAPPVPNDANGSESSPTADGHGDYAPAANANVPKPKRLACMICRKRKLKCNGTRPSCSTCTRLGHTCAYDEVRRKSGPKRGYVKALEERLKQVESLLKTNEPATASPDASRVTPPNPFESRNQSAAAGSAATANFHVATPSVAIGNDRDMDRWQFTGESPQAGNMDEFNFANNISIGMNNMDNSFTWEMIGLGLEEPLPPQETIDELHQIYFDKIHTSLPMIHKFRYLAAMNLAPNQRPPVALRYAMWTMACSITEKYADLKDLFYQRARKYMEADYIKGYGEHMISVAHAQTHVLLALYEFKMMYFPRAWMSTGAAVRLCQMIGLHRLDGNGLDVKQCLPPPRDWTEREERRRTFWMAFCEDRYASIGTGWPMTVDERDIMTNLPSSEEAFEMSRPEMSQPLQDAMTPTGAAKLSSFGGIALMACLFGRNLIHLHRPDAEDRDHDLNGEFWKRHRNMDNILLNTSLCLPSHLKLPCGLGNPNIVFTNMNIHTSTICLHQAAIFKADKNRLPGSVSAESKVRCITAANEIASIMKMVSHMDLSAMNPFISFCLYVASRVFVQYLKSRPDDSQTADSLRFLLAAMNALKRKNPLTESFLVQLDVDLEALGQRIPKLKSAFPRSADSPSSTNVAARMSKNKENCEGTEPSGIMAYRNECNFIKITGDSGNPMDTPAIVEPENQNRPRQNDSANWLPGDQRLPTRERSSASEACGGIIVQPISFDQRLTPGNGYGDSASSGTNDMSLSPNPDSQSNRPTPNSSSASEQQRASERTSFDTSPIGSHQAEMDAATAAFFPDTSTFSFPGAGNGTGMTPGHDFSMSNGWEMPGTGSGTGMTPVADGVLRHLMNLPPMDAMDIGWDSGA
ncbi:fungal-specific transcription factor domain-containing protein [Pseudomassariella vexata]|uniref:Fungal-specific transcription factor domain-containing protein n=1 Tax=Pseudomassariella vexata TaxID=1141098 RepID=A0A1Y2DT30_9PEZI|nr:fungal-specific transcription factor domain-containing protein [Pseudomassariella vexata]ORY62304.1 fungal-specific transcription factor domain-containing protein [Pseudomassariella vexata]